MVGDLGSQIIAVSKANRSGTLPAQSPPLPYLYRLSGQSLRERPLQAPLGHIVS